MRHHWRFWAACGIGLVVYAAMLLASAPEPASAAGDAFCATYLISCAHFVWVARKADLSHRAHSEDEGMVLVNTVALFVATVNIVGIFMVLNSKSHDALSLVLALAAAPLGWLTLHTIWTFHYADLFYFNPDGREPCLDFPGTKEPGPWDFLYFSFVIGMTAQVSDVQVLSSRMRKAVLGHSVISFAYNTVLIAMAVNVAIANAG
jgi:uncharacterized membrane protein